MSENLYQLRFPFAYPIHYVVPVDGPHDWFGYVVSVKDTNKHGVLHLIRGTGRTARSP